MGAVRIATRLVLPLLGGVGRLAFVLLAVLLLTVGLSFSVLLFSFALSLTLSLSLALSLSLLAALLHRLAQFLLFLLGQVWFEAQRSVWNHQRVVGARHGYCDVCSHPRPKLHVRVRNINNRAVGNHVLQSLRVQTDLTDLSAEALSGVRIYGKVRAYALFDLTYVGFVYRSENLHFGQVIGNRKQHRGLKTCGDGLANVYGSRNNDAIDRRSDDGVIQIDLCLLELCLSLSKTCLGLIGLGLR